MISSLLQGGLGNYMFQIAVAESLAKDLGTKAGFDFNLAAQGHKNIRTYQDNILRNVTDVPNIRTQSRFTELDFGYNELPKKDSQTLIGYFQTEKYFKHNRDHIVHLFRLPYGMINRVWEDYENVYIDNLTCSIHVRRGDYLKLPNHHPTLTMEYYKKAMEEIRADKYLIFSDDMKWCKANFVGNKFTFIENEPDYIDMYMMSICHNHIIANSSFSWWGAWLNTYNDKIVVAPNKWFGPAKGDINTKDLIPEEWIKI